MKLLLVLLAAAAAIALIKRRAIPGPHGPGAKPGTREVEPMLACHSCGLHVPSSDCVWRDGQPYCCADHAGRE